jgi:membrane protease YdiL (CAAX protease family)
MNLRSRKTLLFILLTFFIDWAMVGVYLLAGGKAESSGMAMLAVFYMFVPMLVALMLQRRVFNEPVAGPLGFSFKINRWFFVAWFLPPVIAFAAIGVSLLMPGVTFTPDMSGFLDTLASALTPEQMAEVRGELAAMPVNPIWLVLVLALIAGTTVNAIAALGEEVGWRGFLVRELGHLGFWKSSVLIGLTWGVWHAPLVLLGLNYPHNPQLGVLVMIAWTTLLSPIFSYIRLKSRSVIAAAILHGTINAVPGLALLPITGGDELTVGITGLAGFIVLAFVNLALFIFDRFITPQPVSTILKETAE